MELVAPVVITESVVTITTNVSKNTAPPAASPIYNGTKKNARTFLLARVVTKRLVTAFGLVLVLTDLRVRKNPRSAAGTMLPTIAACPKSVLFPITLPSMTHVNAKNNFKVTLAASAKTENMVTETFVIPFANAMKDLIAAMVAAQTMMLPPAKAVERRVRVRRV